MRIEIISSEEFHIFVNNLYLKIDNYEHKEEIVEAVKGVISSVRGKLHLRGFYKLKVFVNEKIGLFIEGVKLEGLEYSNALDLRVVVFFDEDIYFKTEEYFVIGDVSNVKYFDGYYYCLVDDIADINKVVEFGEFIYGRDALDVIDKSISI